MISITVRASNLAASWRACRKPTHRNSGRFGDWPNYTLKWEITCLFRTCQRTATSYVIQLLELLKLCEGCNKGICLPPSFLPRYPCCKRQLLQAATSYPGSPCQEGPPGLANG